MKKLTLFLLASILFSFAGFAQEKKMDKMDKKMDKMDKMPMKDGVMMKDGKMMMMKDGKTMDMDKEMTMTNGTKVMTDGKMMMKDGKAKMMKDGDCIYMDGKMTHMKMDPMKKKPAGR